MGCPNCSPMLAIRKAAEQMPYRETLVSVGVPMLVDYRGRCRQVKRIKALDPRVRASYTKAAVFFDGPAGSELVVEFVIV